MGLVDSHHVFPDKDAIEIARAEELYDALARSLKRMLKDDMSDGVDHEASLIGVNDKVSPQSAK
jgi:hypothetical protein